ncbi:MAG TPA: MG2 domain-containing protein, partial [Gemmataceae bacterium]|nr:MG2 domain-containing protein [Gemmataceae bacterium]
IKVSKLLDDVKAYLRSNPGQIDWAQANVGDIGYRLVEQQQGQYLGARVAAWDMDLQPRPGHVDDRVTVTAPLDKPGAYLLTAQMAGGNVSRIIVWVSDTVLVRKQLEGRNYYFVADAVTGKPVAKADVDFFGWQQVQAQPNRPVYRVDTAAFTATTDDDGQVIVGQDKMLQNHQWLVTARKAKDGAGGADRFAYLGFDYAWYNRIYDPEYNQTKVFTITDRPVYRPGQTVQFKFWVRHAKYDQPNASDFAGQPFVVQIHNPRGEKVLEKTFTADAYGGVAGEFPLPKDAMLGAYGLMIVNHGGGSFRVEEYKKPEYEVTVEAPKEPVQLGEQVVATVHAKYYFGAPVIKAKVKVKVLRQSYTDTWYPRGAWDWFYGVGYWWFAPDYDWYPGFSRWGCLRPLPIWWNRPAAPPEVVLENEVNIGPDGTVQVPIDTALAKELHGNEDHKYTITAEVTDDSRRTIVGTGDVLVSREPFKVFAWVDRGHYRAGDTVRASFRAQTLDRKPVEGKGELTLYRVSYNDKHEPVEKAVWTWKLNTNAEGEAHERMMAAEPGQYRLSYRLTDTKGHAIEGGYLFVVTDQGYDGHEFRFNDIELITDKREYAPGDKVKLLINTNRDDGTVLLFVRPTNGVYVRPQVIRLHGKSTEQQIAVVQRDMPNFFIEALTVSGGKVHDEVREVVVPPEKRVLNVTVLPSAKEYRPGQKATVKVKVTDFFGKPFVGSTVLTVYDKSVEYISGGSNVPEIREFFWKWRRHHQPQTETDASRVFGNLLHSGEVGMGNLGVFGATVVEEMDKTKGEGRARLREEEQSRRGAMGAAPAAPGMAAARMGAGKVARDGIDALHAHDSYKALPPAPPEQPPGSGGQRPAGGGQQPVVRKNFADTAFWAASLTTAKDGTAEVTYPMPEQLTGWKIKVWSLGHGTKVGEGDAEVVTKKDLLVRLQAPRFFTQTDEVVLSANVHNYLKAAKPVKVSLELDGGTLVNENDPVQTVSIPAAGEKRVDWRVRVVGEGQAVVRMKAITDEESDAMEMRFPCYVHGMLKTETVSGALRPNQDAATATLAVPAERRVNETRLEVRWSPTLAGAMVDALPYLVDYPYGCTEQTLNRFLPTVITQRVLQRMNLDLKAIRDKRTNLNAQEIGDPKARAKGWQRYPHNPVFDEDEVKRMARSGVEALAGMQLGDGGWGWFSGYGEQSWPHTTALVVHGLLIARENDVALPPGMLERGVQWLKNYQETQTQLLRNAPTKTDPYKAHADNLDALVHMVLTDANAPNDEMREYVYRDRNELTVYAKALYGLALQKQQQADKLAMILKNIGQYVVQDDENQTAYLKLPEGNAWWFWYGSDVEADAAYLKLLARTDPKGETASRLVKYLLNNRKHATYWNSTRDTSFCVEAMAEFLKASGEDRPNMTVELLLDGRKMKEVHVDASNLFAFDNSLVLTGDAVDTGKHTLEVRRKGTGPVYFNAYLTNFTLENFITRAGLEVRVNRKYYKLNRVDKTVKVTDVRGQAIDQKVEKYERQELPNLSTLKSGDLVEVELEIDSKNDYEYLVFEDPEAAGFEPLLVRSGYDANDLGAYMELRDEKVCFFVRRLARGKHSVSYRLRAEIPGRFSALPTRAYAMYAPELRGNSDEIKLMIKD